MIGLISYACLESGEAPEAPYFSWTSIYCLELMKITYLVW